MGYTPNNNNTGSTIILKAKGISGNQKYQNKGSLGNEQHTCSTGICIDFSETDVNTGIGNFPGNHTKDECFAECQKMRNKLSTKMTGCEHKHGIECHYHTKPIAKGNGREGS